MEMSEKIDLYYCKIGEKNPNFKYKINAMPMLLNALEDCEREQMVSYYQMAPLVRQTEGIYLKDADYILLGHPVARVEDFTDNLLRDLELINNSRKKGAEIIVMGKATNVKPLVEGKYDNITYVDSHFAEYLAKRFGFDFKEEYVLYDDRTGFLNIWPVDGCLNKCGFCRRSYMNIPFESQPLDFLKERLDWFKKNKPEQMKHVRVRAENLTEYGLDIYGKQCFEEIIRLVDSYDEVEKIDYPIGMNIGEITPEILEALCNSKKTNLIGLNIEAGSDRLLKLINKKHDTEKIKYVYKELIKANPSIYITSTFMIGLPTEELEDILQLGLLIDEIMPDSLLCNYYGYSPKHPLAKYPQLDQKVKEYHLNFLIKLLKDNKDRNYMLKFSYEAPFRKNKRIDERIKKEIIEDQKASLPRIINRRHLLFVDGVTINYTNGDELTDEFINSEYRKKVKKIKESQYSKKL